MWIGQSNYFTRAYLEKEGSDWERYRAYSNYRHSRDGTEIIWSSRFDGKVCYPVMVRYTDNGEIYFENIRPGIATRHNIDQFTERVDNYVIHNDSGNSVKVHGFDEIPPGGVLGFSEADFCGEHLDGFTVIGHGTVISAPAETKFSWFLESPGTIEKITDKIWHFYTDKGHGGFGKADFLLTSVTKYEINGNLLTLQESGFDKEWVIRVLLDDIRSVDYR
jgi:hypothetical protein